MLLQFWRKQLRFYFFRYSNYTGLWKSAGPLFSPPLISYPRRSNFWCTGSRTFYWITVPVGKTCTRWIFCSSGCLLISLHLVIWKLRECWSPHSVISLSFLTLWLFLPLWYWSGGTVYFRQALINRDGKNAKLGLELRTTILIWPVEHLFQNDLLAKR